LNTSSSFEHNYLAAFFSSSNFEEGEKKTREYLLKYPKDVILLNTLGVFLLHQNKLDEAEQIFRKAILGDPSYAEAYCNLGLLLSKKNFLKDAERCFKEAIKKNENLIIAYNNLGIVYKNFGKYDEAIENYSIAIKKNPQYFEAYNNLGIVFVKQKKKEEAYRSFEKCIEINPNFADAYNNMGGAIDEFDEDVERSIRYFKYALEKNPKYEDAAHNLGSAYSKIMKFDESFKYLFLATEIDPNFSMAWNTIGITYYKMGNFQKAEGFYNKAINLDQNNTEAHFNLGVQLLRTGNYENGWKEREIHRIKKGFLLDFKNPRSRWKGEQVKGTLLVYREQGVGDEILFLSMFYDIIKFADNIILEVDVRLKKLLQNFLDKHEVKKVTFLDYDTSSLNKDTISNPYKNIKFKKQISIGSMGMYLRSKKSDFLTAKHPYLYVNSNVMPKFKLRDLVKEKKKLSVGFSWKTLNQKENWRNLPICTIEQFLNKNPDIAFINLQFGYNQYDEITFKNFKNFYSFSKLDLKNDLYSVAEVINQLDLVLTIQNAIGHLSCALGKKTYVLLSIFPRLNWGLQDEGNVSDWYPTAKVFRQAKYGIWNDLENKVLDSLDKEKQALIEQSLLSKMSF